MAELNSSPSGERRPLPPGRVPFPKPLAGCSTYAQRLAAFRAGRGPKPAVAPFLGLQGQVRFPEKIERLKFPDVADRAVAGRILRALALGAAAAALAAMLTLLSLRSASALVPWLPPVALAAPAGAGALAAAGVTLLLLAAALVLALRSSRSSRER